MSASYVAASAAFSFVILNDRDTFIVDPFAQ